MNLPYSGACERNKKPIFEILQNVLSTSKNVLEIATGIGQHAIYFGDNLKHFYMANKCSRRKNSPINARLNLEGSTNVIAPLMLDATQTNWPKFKFGALFISNLFHIAHWEVTVQTFERIQNIMGCVFTPPSFGH